MEEDARTQALEEAILREKKKKRNLMIKFAVRLAVSVALLVLAIILVRKYCS